MSYITKALKKIQDLRQPPEKIIYLTDAPEAWPQTALRILLVVCIMTAILISITGMILTMRNSDSKQTEIIDLEKNIKTQEKRMDDLVNAINKNEKVRDIQISQLKSRLNKVNSDTKGQINNSMSADNEHYATLKDALLNDQENISLLDNEIKVLDQKIEAMSVPSAQAKDATSPVSGN